MIVIIVCQNIDVNKMTKNGADVSTWVRERSLFGRKFIKNPHAIGHYREVHYSTDELCSLLVEEDPLMGNAALDVHNKNNRKLQKKTNQFSTQMHPMKNTV